MVCKLKIMNNSFALKSILILQTLALVGYTLYVVMHEGWNFLEVAVSNVGSLTWSGQFSLDFACYLLLSGLWIMWRSKYSVPSVVMGVAAMILGIVVFAPYLFYLLVQEHGDLRQVLLGKWTSP